MLGNGCSFCWVTQKQKIVSPWNACVFQVVPSHFFIPSMNLNGRFCRCNKELRHTVLCTIKFLCNVIDKTALKKAEVSPLKSPCSTILNSCYKWLGTLWLKESCSLFPLALGKGCSSSLWLCDFSAVFKSHSQDGWPPWHPSLVPTSCFLPGLAKGDMSLWLKCL